MDDDQCGDCGKEFDPEEEGKFYGYCPECEDDQVSQLQRLRNEYAENVEIRVERFNIDIEGEEDEDDEDEPPYLRALRQAAEANALDQRSGYAERHGETSDQSYRPDSDRAVVSMLRHRATNYDEIVEGLPCCLQNGNECESLDRDKAYFRIRERVHWAIGGVYPEIVDLLEQVIQTDEQRLDS